MIQGVIAVTDCANLPVTNNPWRIQGQGVADDIQRYPQGLHVHGDIIQEHFITVGAITQAAAGHGVGRVERIAGPANGTTLADVQISLQGMVEKDATHTDSRRPGEADISELHSPILDQVIKVQGRIVLDVDPNQMKRLTCRIDGRTNPEAFQMDAFVIVIVGQTICCQGKVQLHGQATLTADVGQRGVVEAFHIGKSPGGVDQARQPDSRRGKWPATVRSHIIINLLPITDYRQETQAGCLP